MNEIQPLLDAMQFKQGFIMAISSWMAFFRIVGKPVGAWLQTALTKMIVNYPDGAARIVRHVGYKIFSFIVDLIFSAKLPSVSSVEKQISENQTAFLEKSEIRNPKSKIEEGHVLVELVVLFGVILLVLFILSFCIG